MSQWEGARKFADELRNRLEKSKPRIRINTPTKTLVNVDDLNFNYGNVRALRHIDLNISDGEIVALMGRNGSGKSTLLSQLVGLLSPTSGSILIDGKTTVKPKSCTSLWIAARTSSAALGSSALVGSSSTKTFGLVAMRFTETIVLNPVTSPLTFPQVNLVTFFSIWVSILAIPFSPQPPLSNRAVSDLFRTNKQLQRNAAWLN